MEFLQQVQIQAPLAVVDRCITEPGLMRQWLNPVLECRSVGDWSTEVGSRFQFLIRLPPYPALECEVIQRELGLVEWRFDGFFTGTDRWECHEEDPDRTLLVNRFCFTIASPLVRFGFDLFARDLTRRDMGAQLERLKTLAQKTARAP